jgi:hypothetical protein
MQPTLYSTDHELSKELKEFLAKQLNVYRYMNFAQTSNPQYDMNRLMQMTGSGQNIPARQIYQSALQKVENPLSIGKQK